MTIITYTGDGMIMEGHTIDPIVCHGISAVSQMVANYVTDNHWGSVVIGEGKLEIHGVEQHFGCDLFMATARFFKDVEREHPEDIKIVYEI